MIGSANAEFIFFLEPVNGVPESEPSGLGVAVSFRGDLLSVLGHPVLVAKPCHIRKKSFNRELREFARNGYSLF